MFDDDDDDDGDGDDDDDCSDQMSCEQSELGERQRGKGAARASTFISENMHRYCT
jgi:hypothetical protein